MSAHATVPILGAFREKCLEDVRRLESALLNEYLVPPKNLARRRWLFEARDHNATEQPPESVAKIALRRFLTERKPPEVLAEGSS